MSARLPTAESERAAQCTVMEYEREKQRYLMEHPGCTRQEYEAFIRSLVKRLGL